MNPLIILRKEHEELQSILNELESSIGEEHNLIRINLLISKLGKFWNKHEEREERFLDWFNSNYSTFPFDKMLINEHKELRGHWKVLNSNLIIADNDKLNVALDTDGRMLIEKFRNHINKEEAFFNELILRNLNLNGYG